MTQRMRVPDITPAERKSGLARDQQSKAQSKENDPSCPRGDRPEDVLDRRDRRTKDGLQVALNQVFPSPRRGMRSTRGGALRRGKRADFLSRRSIAIVVCKYVDDIRSTSRLIQSQSRRKIGSKRSGTQRIAPRMRSMLGGLSGYLETVWYERQRHSSSTKC
jgi:hypothetical protein